MPRKPPESKDSQPDELCEFLVICARFGWILFVGVVTCCGWVKW